jgi:hypothetical protein
MDGSTPLKHSRVLRAADVIPPFRSDSASGDNPETPDPIPTFDLAESILAEQRRVASGKRRRATSASSRGMGEASSFRPVVQPFGPPRDLTELHRIVADIVSRDIERLCTGPAVAL